MVERKAEGLRAILVFRFVVRLGQVPRDMPFALCLAKKIAPAGPGYFFRESLSSCGAPVIRMSMGAAIKFGARRYGNYRSETLMKSPIYIRSVAQCDKPQILKIIETTLKSLEIEVCSETLRRDLLECDRCGALDWRGKGWVMVDDDKVIGSVSIHPRDAKICELKHMYLLPAYQGRGYGSQLLRLALGFAREQGFTQVRLDTHSKMRIARILYAKFGFQSVQAAASNCGCDQSLVLQDLE